MKSRAKLFIERTSSWPSSYDDTIIDDIIWAEIKDSDTVGDFACYLVHRPQKAKHMDEAKARYADIDEGLDAAPKLYFNAINRIQALAESGDSGAMFHMGKIFSIGIAVNQDFTQAQYWYKKAIDLGDVRACCNLGWLYQSGFGLPKDFQKGFELLSRGAESGVVVAKATIGMMMLAGEGCVSDPLAAVKILEECFEADYNNAANCLADAYFAGEYITRDVEVGFHWLERVSNRGDYKTMAMMGHYLVTGIHGKRDVPRGISYLMEAVNHGNNSACLWLGSLYEQGKAIDSNIDMAHMLYQRGVDGGDEDCEFALARLLNASAPPPASGSTSIN